MKFSLIFLIFVLFASMEAAQTVRENNSNFEISGPGVRILVEKMDGKIQVAELGGIRFSNVGNRPAEFGELTFTAEELESGKIKLKWDTEFSRIGTDVTIIQKTNLGKSAGIDLENVEATRRLSVSGGERMKIEYSFRNPEKSPRFISFGIRNEFFINVNGRDMAYVPTENNVLDFGGGQALWGYYTQPDPWFFDLSAGWYGIVNKMTRNGIATVFDYDASSAVYIGRDCRTNGVMLTGGMLAPGKTFTTGVEYIPLKGLDSLYHAASAFSAGIGGSQENVTLGFLPGKNEKYSGTLTVFEAKNEKILGTYPFEFKGIKGKHQRISFKIPKPETQTVNRITVNGETFEQYRENGFRMQSLPMVPLKVAYKRNAPEKKLTVYNDDLKLAVREDAALLLFGPYANFFRFDRILNGWEMKIISAPPQGLREIPPATTIDRYKIILLGDVNIESIRGIQPRLLSYVKNGGTLVVGGGPFAYGCGGYTNSLLATILPVIPAPFDLRPAAGDGKFNVPSASRIGEIYWLHTALPRPGAKIILKTENKPLIVEGCYGKGKVYAILAAPLGNGSASFWDSPDYVNFMKSILVTK